VPLARADVRDVWFAHWPLDPDELASRLPATLDPASLAGWLTERYRYYRPDGRAGQVSHPPWALAKVTGTVEAPRLFAAADVSMPETAPVCRYSPGTPITLRSRP